MKKIAAASIAIALTAGGFAEAATMTFEGAGPVYDYSSTWEYSENGITAKVTGAYANPASSSPENTSLVLGYLDGHLPIRATFTMETPFHAISFLGRMVIGRDCTAAIPTMRSLPAALTRWIAGCRTPIHCCQRGDTGATRWSRSRAFSISRVWRTPSTPHSTT